MMMPPFLHLLRVLLPFITFFSSCFRCENVSPFSCTGMRLSLQSLYLMCERWEQLPTVYWCSVVETDFSIHQTFLCHLHLLALDFLLLFYSIRLLVLFVSAFLLQKCTVFWFSNISMHFLILSISKLITNTHTALASHLTGRNFFFFPTLCSNAALQNTMKTRVWL